MPDTITAKASQLNFECGNRFSALLPARNSKSRSRKLPFAEALQKQGRGVHKKWKVPLFRGQRGLKPEAFSGCRTKTEVTAFELTRCGKQATSKFFAVIALAMTT